MSKIEVKYNGIVVGHTEDECKTIRFLDNDAAMEVKELMNNKLPISVSSRKAQSFDIVGKPKFNDVKLNAVYANKRKKIVDDMLSTLNGRGGFDGWWDDIDEETQQEIRGELELNLLNNGID